MGAEVPAGEIEVQPGLVVETLLGLEVGVGGEIHAEKMRAGNEQLSKRGRAKAAGDIPGQTEFVRDVQHAANFGAPLIGAAGVFFQAAEKRVG